MKTLDNPILLRKKIDDMIDYRRLFRPNDTGDIVVSMTPSELSRAVGHPPPAGGKPYPTSVLFRGYRIVSQPPKKPQRRRAMGATWL
jgi:hypothetical protein